jgi:hypothetical protein
MTKFANTTLSLAFAAMTFVAGTASAETITFDDVPNNASLSDGVYHGLSWTNFFVFDGTQYAPGSGYEHGTVSAPNVAFNSYANPASFGSASAFSLHDAYFAAAWNDGLTIHVVGTSGTNTYIKDIVVNTGAAIDVVFNWTNLTNVAFSSSGGTFHEGLGGTGEHFVMDNMTVNAVPEPETYAMLLAGLGLMGAVARRRQKQA